MARQAQDTAESFGQHIGDALGSAKQKLTETAHDLRDSANDAVDQVKDTASSATDQLGQKAQAIQMAGSSFMSAITNNPMALGAIGLALGAVLGALTPQSEREVTALGDVAEKARKGAADLAQKVVDRGGEIAQQAIDAGVSSAQEHGLTGDKSIGDLAKGAVSGDLTDSVKQVAQSVLQAGEKAAHGTANDGVPAS